MPRPRNPHLRHGVVFVNIRKQMLKGYRPGSLTCWRCLVPITDTDTSKIILGHSDDGSRIMGPEHRACNNRGRMTYEAAKRWAAKTGGQLVELRPGIIGIPGTRPWLSSKRPSLKSAEDIQSERRVAAAELAVSPGRRW